MSVTVSPPPPDYNETIRTGAVAMPPPSQVIPNRRTNNQFIPTTTHQQQGPVRIGRQSPAVCFPREIQPNDYLILSIVVAIVCGILNITSLGCSMLAILQASKAFESRYTSGDLERTKKHGDCAARLIIACVVWVMLCAILITGITAGIYFTRH